MTFNEWWNGDDAHKAKHEGDEAVAKAAWNAALTAAYGALDSHVGGPLGAFDDLYVE